MINVVRMLTTDEGLKNRVYKDDRGNNTVGIGFNMDNPAARGVWIRANIPESFNSIYNNQSALTTPSAWALLNFCVADCKVDLKKIFTAFDTYPEGVQLALINLMFNLGRPKFTKFDTFISLAISGKYAIAAEDLKLTLWAKQLPNRCKRVCALLNGDDAGYS